MASWETISFSRNLLDGVFSKHRTLQIRRWAAVCILVTEEVLTWIQNFVNLWQGIKACSVSTLVFLPISCTHSVAVRSQHVHYLGYWPIWMQKQPYRVLSLPMNSEQPVELCRKFPGHSILDTGDCKGRGVWDVTWVTERMGSTCLFKIFLQKLVTSNNKSSDHKILITYITLSPWTRIAISNTISWTTVQFLGLSKQVWMYR